MGIFCKTIYKQIIFFLECTKHSIVVVTVYSTVADESIKVVLDETEVKAVLT